MRVETLPTITLFEQRAERRRLLAVIGRPRTKWQADRVITLAREIDAITHELERREQPQ